MESKTEQKLINLSRSDGQYYNFFNTPNSIESLESYLKNGWCVLKMDINPETQSGWVLLERRK